MFPIKSPLRLKRAEFLNYYYVIKINELDDE